MFLLIAVWGLATPLGAAPDEPTQFVKAAAVARGQLVGSLELGEPKAVVVVKVPEVFSSMLHVPACYDGRSDTPA